MISSFNFFSIPFGDMTNFLISNFKNENFQFFHSEFSWHISIFSFPSGGMAIFSNFKINFFSIFSFPYGGMAKQNSKFKNTNFLFKIQKRFFFISNFPCGINNFFSAQGCQIYFKNYKNYIFTLIKNSHILHKSTIKEPLRRVGDDEGYYILKAFTVG
jgi:hypothetical protein